MNKPYMSLQPTEIALLDAASRIYAARLVAGQVPGAGETEALSTAVSEAIALARAIDESVMADKELD
ncbi:hypothetical protein OAJ60_03100 [Planctomycetaceae bacterium]|nr:hypothetical protein [Planctomycetaceae bacterium]